MAKKVETKNIEMVVKNDRLLLVDLIMGRLDKKTSKWSKEENSDKLVANTPNGGAITIVFPAEFDGEFKLTMDEKAKEFYDEMDTLEKQDITEKDVKDSPFKQYSPSSFKNGTFANLNKNITVFKEICEWFKQFGFESIGTESNFGYGLAEKAFKDLTLLMEPDVNDYNSENIDDPLKPYRKLEGFRGIPYRCNHLKASISETVIKLMVDKMCVGYYYKERNLVLIWYNIFNGVNLQSAKSFRDNKFLDVLTKDLEKAFSDAKIKKVDNKDFMVKLTVINFNRANNARLKQVEKDHKDYDRRIHDTETSLTSYYQKRVQLGDEIKVLSMLDDDQVNNFIKEVEKLRAVPIVTGVELKDGALEITFKETTIKAPLSRSIGGDHTSGPITEMFIGAITVKITGSGVATVSCSHPGPNGKPHPHATVDGRPCLGSGDGPAAMHRLIGERKFADFAYVFWMWIKRWRPEDCYVMPHDYYDDRLKKGLPIFNQLGERVKINDKDLIKTGLQRTLKKDPLYKTNYPKYAGYTAQK